ncbi:MAG: glycosyltransferase family 2 protein [Cetobacterium sp.]
MNNIKVAGVVVLYYPDEKVEKNIKSYIDKVEKLWIIDNTPEIDKKNFLKYKNEKIIYKKFNRNMGIAFALNYASKLAKDKGFEWLLTMDQDSIFQENSLENLIDFIDKAPDNTAIISPFHQIKGSKKNSKRNIEEKEIVMTSGNLVNLNILEKNRYFLEKLFIDEVDHEYCYRVKNNNYKIFQINTSILNHELGDIKIYKLFKIEIKVTNHSSIRHYYMSRNRIYIIKNYKTKRIKYIKMLLFGFIKTLLFEKEKIKKIKLEFKGIKDGIFNNYGEYIR